MITLDEVATLIRGELRGALPPGVTLDESTQLEDLGLSSLQVSEIVFTLERERVRAVSQGSTAPPRHVHSLLPAAAGSGRLSDLL